MNYKKSEIHLVSLFSGAGGLDTGFEAASHLEGGVSFRTVWANEYDKAIWETYRSAFPGVELNTNSITKIVPSDLIYQSGKSVIEASQKTQQNFGLIGGPPCQSWSAAGSKRGVDDHRGQLFWDYIRILKAVKPLFFVAENVPGILAERNSQALQQILLDFGSSGYDVKYAKLNAAYHNVPEDRERVIFVGFRSDTNGFDNFSFPKPSNFDEQGKPVKRVMADVAALKELAISAQPFDAQNRSPNQNEYLEGGFSSLYLSRNRCRTWSEPSFTIQATGRHAPIHMDHGKMTKVDTDKFAFSEDLRVRRLTVRECAEIQTFPSDYPLVFSNVVEGYKMIGNAVPVNLAKAVAESIAAALSVTVKVSSRGGSNQRTKLAEFCRVY